MACDRRSVLCLTFDDIGDTNGRFNQFTVTGGSKLCGILFSAKLTSDQRIPIQRSSAAPDRSLRESRLRVVDGNVCDWGVSNAVYAFAIKITINLN